MSFTFPIQIANRTRFEITVSEEVPVTELFRRVGFLKGRQGGTVQSIQYLAWISLSSEDKGDMLTIKPAYGNQKG